MLLFKLIKDVCATKILRLKIFVNKRRLNIFQWICLYQNALTFGIFMQMAAAAGLVVSSAVNPFLQISFIMWLSLATVEFKLEF